MAVVEHHGRGVLCRGARGGAGAVTALRTVPSSVETEASGVLRALHASGQITMRKVDGWQILAETADPPIHLAA